MSFWIIWTEIFNYFLKCFLLVTFAKLNMIFIFWKKCGNVSFFRGNLIVWKQGWKVVSWDLLDGKFWSKTSPSKIKYKSLFKKTHVVQNHNLISSKYVEHKKFSEKAHKEYKIHRLSWISRKENWWKFFPKIHVSPPLTRFMILMFFDV